VSAGRIRQGGVFVEIGADARQFFAALNKVQKEVARVGQAMTSIGSRMAGIGAALGAPFIAASVAGSRLQDVMLNMQASTGATASDLDQVRKAAMSMSQAMGVGPTEIAAGFLELLKAGMGLEDVLGGAGKAAIAFSKVGGMTVADAAVVMADAMNVFKVSGDTAANTLSAAADASSTSIQGIAMAFSQVSNVAGLANQSIGDTAAALAVLANAGVKGSDAGTSLKTMLLRLMAPADDAVGALQQLGLNVQSFRNADGTMKPLVQIIGTLTTAMQGMDQAAKDDIFRRIFGQDAIRAAAVLTTAGVDGFQAMRDSMDGAATVGDKFATMSGGLSGAASSLFASLERLAIVVSDALGPALMQLSQTIGPAINGITQFASQNQGLVVNLAAGVAAVGAAGIAMLGLGQVVGLVASTMGTLLMASKAVVAPLFAIVATVSSMIMSFAAAVAGILAYSATSIAAAAASGAAWVTAHAPLAILLGLIAALGVAAFNLVGGFDGLSASIRQGVASAATDASVVLSDLGRVAKTTMQGVYDSIVAGDLEGAMAIALKGLLAAWIRGTSALQGKIDGFFAFIMNSADAAATIASNPLIAFDAIQSPEIVADRRALQRRQDARLNQVTADQKSRDAKAVQAENDLRNMTRDAGLTRTLRGQADGVIANVGNAGSMQQLTDLADEFFTLRDTGKLSVEQQQKYLDAVDSAIDRLNTRSAANGSAETAPMTRADSDRRSFRSQADSALEQLASATSMEQVKELGDELSALAETGHLTEQQMQGLGGAVQAAQERVMRNAVEQAAAQSEVVGTFSADAVGGMGFGSSLQQKQLEELKGIRQEVKKLNDDGAVAA
jgi:TP901 family phage tail tape measure protein